MSREKPTAKQKQAAAEAESRMSTQRRRWAEQAKKRERENEPHCRACFRLVKELRRAKVKMVEKDLCAECRERVREAKRILRGDMW